MRETHLAAPLGQAAVEPLAARSAAAAAKVARGTVRHAHRREGRRNGRRRERRDEGRVAERLRRAQLAQRILVKVGRLGVLVFRALVDLFLYICEYG